MNRKSAFIALSLAIAIGNVSVAMASANKHTYAHHIYGWAADRAPADPRDAIAPGDAWVVTAAVDPCQAYQAVADRAQPDPRDGYVFWAAGTRRTHAHHGYIAYRAPADPRDAY
jgi:hypothetical protein